MVKINFTWNFEFKISVSMIGFSILLSPPDKTFSHKNKCLASKIENNKNQNALFVDRME